MRHGIKILGMTLLAALSLMAVTVVAAQAGEFRKGGKTFAELKILEEPALGTATEGELLTAGEVKIHCTGGTGTAKIKQGGTGTAEALFTGCKVLGAEKTCTIFEELPEVGKESIKATGNGKLLLHPEEGKAGQEHYLLVEGLGESKLFADFLIKGKLCPLPTAEHYTVTGSTVLKLPDILTSQLLHAAQTVDAVTLEKLFPKDQLFLGKEKADLAVGTTVSLHLFEVGGVMASWSGE